MSDKSSFLKSEILATHGLEGELKAFKRIKRKSKAMALASLVSFQEQKHNISLVDTRFVFFFLNCKSKV